MPAVMVLIDHLTADGTLYQKGQVVAEPGIQLARVAQQLEAGQLHFTGAAVAKFVSPEEIRTSPDIDSESDADRKIRELRGELAKMEAERKARQKLLLPPSVYKPRFVPPVVEEDEEEEAEVVPIPASARPAPPPAPPPSEPIGEVPPAPAAPSSRRRAAAPAPPPSEPIGEVPPAPAAHSEGFEPIPQEN